MQTFSIDNLQITAAAGPTDRICYLLYPFANIISLSGSFWYEGFAGWIESHPVPKKTGRAYFLLGNQEARTDIKAFQPVQTDTEVIVACLRRSGIEADFEIVPGNHYQYGEQRLTRAFTRMFT